MNISKELLEKLLIFQKNEITEYHIYRKLAEKIRCPENRRILEDIADDELRHYNVWKSYTQQDVSPDSWRIWKYYWISRILGFTFGVKLMERGEENAQNSYEQMREVIDETKNIIDDENKHEEALLQMLDEERIRYVGSMVLGLNDALVELTGALAGLTLALQNTKLIALTGSITGIAAALSMGASEYLSTKAEKSFKNPVKASIYTGGAYIFTVLFLILPYLLLKNYYLCLGLTLAGAVLIIALFNFYISVAKDESFKRRFLEMAGLSLSVSAFSFLIGFLIRSFLGVDI
ncbi:VIT1/CCC1 transporter family protein [Candidatus Sumerlaeota bacterium]|nr:VIT1/CCC1 transporter family protein [Candidatus Sumerlaeota bacterium]